jgi:hypothetical protein
LSAIPAAILSVPLNQLCQHDDDDDDDDGGDDDDIDDCLV